MTDSFHDANHSVEMLNKCSPTLGEPRRGGNLHGEELYGERTHRFPGAGGGGLHSGRHVRGTKRVLSKSSPMTAF
jgi:hypothetical protein